MDDVTTGVSVLGGKQNLCDLFVLSETCGCGWIGQDD